MYSKTMESEDALITLNFVIAVPIIADNLWTNTDN
jgi:hypothetical protein